jgi:xanthine dehydrogenase accessory factor
VTALVRDIAAAKRRIEAGDSAVLVSVEATAGSAPRDNGTAMLVFADDLVGTIGGGMLEHKAIARAREALNTTTTLPDVETIPLGPAIGQCCGGSVVLGYRLQQAANLGALDDWLGRVHAGATALWLFGAGHVGKAVVNAVTPLGFGITWIDSRPRIFPDGGNAAFQTLSSRAPHLEVARTPAGAAILVMTHSHAQDLDIIDAALKRMDLGFVGLIGSATKRARFLSRLKARGHSEQALARLVCPIGILGITGKEPEVIAVSVAAQLLAHREANVAVTPQPMSMTG